MAFLLVLAAIFLLWRRRKQRQHHATVAVLDEEPHKVESLTLTQYNNINGSMIPVSQTHLGWAPEGPVFSQPQTPSEVHTSSTSPPARAAAPAMSRKQREALGLLRRRTTLLSESAVSSFSNPVSVSAVGTEDLRAEVEQLRREMESIRHVTDAPPVYS